MARTEYEQEKNKTAGQVVMVPCAVCKHPTNHEIQVSLDFNESADAGYGNSVEVWGAHQVVQCKGCSTVSFRKSVRCSEDMEYDENGQAYYPEAVELFPRRDIGRAPMRNCYLVPPKVNRIYLETIVALNNSLPVLAGIGIRALIEMVCKDKRARGKRLVEQIDDLVKIGVMTPEGAKILHRLRYLGNKAAHEVEPHDAEALGLGLDVCEHLLEGVYILPVEARKTLKRPPRRYASKGLPPGSR